MKATALASEISRQTQSECLDRSRRLVNVCHLGLPLPFHTNEASKFNWLLIERSITCFFIKYFYQSDLSLSLSPLFGFAIESLLKPCKRESVAITVFESHSCTGLASRVIDVAVRNGLCNSGSVKNTVIHCLSAGKNPLCLREEREPSPFYVLASMA